MEFHRNAWNGASDAALATAASDMGVTITEVEKAPFVKAVLPMHDEVAAQSENLADLISRIKSIAP